MWPKISCSLLILAVCLQTPGCERKAPLGQTRYVAFSLREVAERAHAGARDDPMTTLGGITRIAGLVHDAAHDDLILVGMAARELPGISLDDLVVALRARLVHDEWPLVSIDPTEHSEESRIQKVSFDGHIGATAFGRDFLEADVLLKRYSLGCLPAAPGVPAYKTLIEDDIVNTAVRAGVGVGGIHWVSAEQGPAEIQRFEGASVQTQGAYRARFWFYSMKPYRAVARDGVFCIEELRIGVRSEVADGDGQAPRAETGMTYDDVRDRFAEMWTEHFGEMSAAHPILKRLKALYDLVAVAEAIRQTSHDVSLAPLLDSYHPEHVAIDPESPLMELYGLVDRSDGLQHLVRISGGIELHSEIRWLNDGDVSPLRRIVVDSRPSDHALAWPLPLAGWNMPNGRDLAATVMGGERDPGRRNSHRTQGAGGCSVLTQSILLNPHLNAGGASVTRFSGFPAAPSAPPPLRGVSMEAIIKEGSFIRDASGHLNSERNEIIRNRPGDSRLSWRPGGEERR
ncbi:MAG: hypothetical protein A2Y77_10000 [Planctomycetes bacterium RBG_13_62_9]|nr:MAG: hypothetical protein A2Y77_10000 [Planctomycetes bacterium RBG_13_62_9]